MPILPYFNGNYRLLKYGFSYTTHIETQNPPDTYTHFTFTAHAV